MTEDIFVGIVKESGSKEPACSGLFKFDPIQGFEGKLLVPFEPKPGEELFELPEVLKGKSLYCLIDGGNFGTILWPDFTGGHRINNFAARIINLRIRQIIRNIHIGAEEKEVKTIYLASPIFARLFRLQAFQTEIETSPYKITIQSIQKDDLLFECTVGKLSVGIAGAYSPEGATPAPALTATSYVELKLNQSVNPIDALRTIRTIEHFFSLLTFNFIKAQEVYLGIECPDETGKKVERRYELERAKLVERAKTEMERHEVGSFIGATDLGPIFDKFSSIFDKIEQSLNWYRIVTAEDRYLEDKFFYCVRMLESLYRNLGIATDSDTQALETITAISKKVEGGPDGDDLQAFITQRIVPIFSKPASLPAVMKDLKNKYQELLAVEFLDERTITKLRAKEAHGSPQKFSSYEYAFMANSYDILRHLYVITILEYCGFSRSHLLAGLKNTHSIRRYFSTDHLKAVVKLLKSAETEDKTSQ